LLELEARSANGRPAIAVLRWPDDHAAVDALRRSHQPRLLVVESADVPVIASDDLEDWVRLPVDDRDVRARLERLWDHFARQPTRPVLDGFGRLLFGDHWVGLSVVDERLMRPLVDRFGNVVSYRDLLCAGWPGQVKDKSILRPRISGLRRRLYPTGLEIRSVRDVGHVLELVRRDPGSAHAD
jgi:hypothetical protein